MPTPFKKIRKNAKIMLDICARMRYINGVGSEPTTKYGGIAQLGERLNGIQEVSGSIPLISTKKHLKS